MTRSQPFVPWSSALLLRELPEEAVTFALWQPVNSVRSAGSGADRGAVHEPDEVRDEHLADAQAPPQHFSAFERRSLQIYSGRAA
eukprot:3575211-Pleurochrysis_carterae.AAC.1